MKFFKKLIRYIKNRLYVKEILIMFTVEEQIPQTSNAMVMHINYLNLNDILNFQHQRYIDIFKKFLKIGDRGYFAYLNNKCIHRSWVKSNEQIVYLHWALPYRLKKNEIFIHYCETAPEVRGKNIYPHVLSKIIDEHQNKKIFILVNKKNIASIKAVRKVGFVSMQTIQIIIIFGIKIKRVLANGN